MSRRALRLWCTIGVVGGIALATVSWYVFTSLEGLLFGLFTIAVGAVLLTILANK